MQRSPVPRGTSPIGLGCRCRTVWSRTDAPCRVPRYWAGDGDRRSGGGVGRDGPCPDRGAARQRTAAVGPAGVEQVKSALPAPGGELAKVPGVRGAGQPALAGQIPGEREPLRVAEQRLGDNNLGRSAAVVIGHLQVPGQGPEPGSARGPSINEEPTERLVSPIVTLGDDYELRSLHDSGAVPPIMQHLVGICRRTERGNYLRHRGHAGWVGPSVWMARGVREDRVRVGVLARQVSTVRG